MYCAAYTKIWEYQDGPHISTVHLIDGRLIACGPFRVPPYYNEFFTPKKDCDAATQTEAIVWYAEAIQERNREPVAGTSSTSEPTSWQQPVNAEGQSNVVTAILEHYISLECMKEGGPTSSIDG